MNAGANQLRDPTGAAVDVAQARVYVTDYAQCKAQAGLSFSLPDSDLDVQVEYTVGMCSNELIFRVLIDGICARAVARKKKK